MSNTIFAQDGKLGVDVDVWSSTQQFQTGTRALANDNRIYIYVKAGGAVSGKAGDVTRSASADFVYTSAATASAAFRADTAGAAAGQYGWVYTSANHLTGVL